MEIRLFAAVCAFAISCSVPVSSSAQEGTIVPVRNETGIAFCGLSITPVIQETWLVAPGVAGCGDGFTSEVCLDIGASHEYTLLPELGCAYNVEAFDCSNSVVAQMPNTNFCDVSEIIVLPQ